MRPKTILLCAALLALNALGGQPPIPVNTDESKVPAYTLPDLLTTQNGVRIADEKAWREIEA